MQQQNTYAPNSDSTNDVGRQSRASSANARTVVRVGSQHAIRPDMNHASSSTCQDGNTLNLTHRPKRESSQTCYENAGSQGRYPCSSWDNESNDLLRRATPVNCKAEEGYQESSDNFETAVSDQPLSPYPYNSVDEAQAEKDQLIKSSDGLVRRDAPRKRKISKQDLCQRSSRYLKRRKMSIAKTAPVNQGRCE